MHSRDTTRQRLETGIAILALSLVASGGLLALVSLTIAVF